MILDEAKKLAETLMAKHNLTGWSFGWHRSSVRAGFCNYKTREISLSIQIAELNEEGTVRNTILHEIAHALCPVGTGHGKLWKRTAIAIGCTGQRCGNFKTPARKFKYQMRCPKCESVLGQVARKPTRSTYSCKQCYMVTGKSYSVIFETCQEKEAR